MGNQTCGGDCSQLLEHQFKIPLNAVNRMYNNFQLIEFNDFFQYPSKFPYILSYLRKSSLKFQDLYFPITQPRRMIGTNLFKSICNDLCWRRVHQLLQKQNILFRDQLFNRATQKHRESSQFYRLLHWVTSNPKLMKSIFKFQYLPKQGLVLIYLPLCGSYDQPTQIVLDDYIPVTSQNSYYFYMPQTITVAMVLLQKGLAKCLGSYQKLRQQSLKDLYEAMIGLPIFMENVGTKDSIQLFSKHYRPNYHIKSYNRKLENHQPQYFRFSLQQDSNVSISIWQQLEDQNFQQRVLPAQIVMELMRIENDNSVIRVGYSSKLHKEKTLLRYASPEQEKSLFTGRQFLLLPGGNYLLHIYTKTDSVTTNSNLITYSQHQLILTYRKESAELSNIKKNMIQNIFLRRKKDLQKCLFKEKVYSAFIWDGFRGILAFRNDETQKIKISIFIKEQYRKKIKFQESQFFQEEFLIKPCSKITISFVKFIEADVGNFYAQNICYHKTIDTKPLGNHFPLSITSSGEIRSTFNQQKYPLAHHKRSETFYKTQKSTPTTHLNPYI